MGKLDTLLSVAAWSAEMGMADELEQLKRQHAEAVLIQAIIKRIRDQIFQYSETAKEILSAESAFPKEAAGAMRLLHIRLQDSGLSPEMFPELIDKEYFSNTTRTIRDNATRLTDQLPLEEREEVENLVTKAGRIPDYAYYTTHLPKLNTYREALPGSKGLGKGARNIGAVVLLLGGIALCISLLVMGLASIDDDAFMRGLGIFEAVTCTGMALLFGMPLFLIGRRGVSAKKTVESIESEVDIETLEDLDKEFGGNVKHVEALLEEGNATMNRFFASFPMLVA